MHKLTSKSCLIIFKKIIIKFVRKLILLYRDETLFLFISYQCLEKI